MSALPNPWAGMRCSLRDLGRQAESRSIRSSTRPISTHKIAKL